MTLKALELFSGIGGIALAEQILPIFKAIVEIEKGT